MRVLAARPHHLGSARDSANAAWILDRFRSWGLDAQIETFHVLFPTPRERVVELVGPGRFRARLQEPALKEDPTSAQQAEQLPTYNAYSPDGDVTAPLVFVNYGIPEDYQQLERLGVSVKGAIVIAKYGRSWRGIKPKVAAEHGAVGCLIYSDPRDDGYHAGDVYPTRPLPARRKACSAAASWTCRSTPATRSRRASAPPPMPSGWSAPRPAPSRRFRCSRSPGRTRSRCWPPSAGRAVPAAWAGRPADHLSPRDLGPARVHLKLRFDWRLVPAYDVIARIPGAVLPDEWVVRGNHHDAWVNGAEDPISGAVAVLEEARAYGALLKQGWRPRRSIVLALWDGEEPMLLGSTEWARDPRRRAEPWGDRLPQHRRQRPRAAQCRRRARPGAAALGGRARRHRSRDRHVGLEALASGRDRRGARHRPARGARPHRSRW